MYKMHNNLLIIVFEQLPDIREEEPGITEHGYQVAVKLIREFDGLEQRGSKTKKGAVLVFLPGINEIEELYNKLQKTAQAK
jgi:HrpA-like RNA helicase